jgi:hypothetical protein
MITLSERSLDLAQRDPTGLPDRVRRAAKPLSIYSAVVILRATPAMLQTLGNAVILNPTKR